MTTKVASPPPITKKPTINVDLDSVKAASRNHASRSLAPILRTIVSESQGSSSTTNARVKTLNKQVTYATDR